MTLLLLDTSAVVHLLERRHNAIVAALRTATEPPVISVVTLGELATGWSALPPESPRRRTYRAARRLRVIDIFAEPLLLEPQGIIASFGECRAASIKGNDAWIAASAHAMSATLVTYDATLAHRYEAIGLVTLLTLKPAIEPKQARVRSKE